MFTQVTLCFCHCQSYRLRTVEIVQICLFHLKQCIVLLKFRIIATQQPDSGVYICTARNSLGSVLVQAELTVQGLYLLSSVNYV